MTGAEMSSPSSQQTLATVRLIWSAIRSPIKTPWLERMYLMIESLMASPATLIDFLLTMPFKESTAMSVVPPPMSTIMLPFGFSMSMLAPMAAATGSSMR